jgi:carboxymethylenebutenolidase
MRQALFMAIANHLLSVEAGELPLTVARAGGKGAAVVVAPSAFGVAADLVAQMEELAREASLVVSFDPFFRGEAGIVPYDDMPRVMKRLQALDRARAYRDLRAAIVWTRAQSGGRVVGLGICLGGPFALMAAADGAVEGVVTWHGSRMENYLERAPEMRCPMRLHFGEVDPLSPAQVVQRVRAAFADHADVRVVVHEGATHGFSHRSAPQAHQAAAERAGMESVRELVAAVVG